MIAFAGIMASSRKNACEMTDVTLSVMKKLGNISHSNKMCISDWACLVKHFSGKLSKIMLTDVQLTMHDFIICCMPKIFEDDRNFMKIICLAMAGEIADDQAERIARKFPKGLKRKRDENVEVEVDSEEEDVDSTDGGN